MKKNSYKIETKNSLWEVVLSNGCYSDHSSVNLVFSANDEYEAWEYLKMVWGTEGFPKAFSNYSCAIVWNDRRYHLSSGGDCYHHRKNSTNEIDWDTDYGDTSRVSISKLDVIYVNPEALVPDTGKAPTIKTDDNGVVTIT